MALTTKSRCPTGRDYWSVEEISATTLLLVDCFRDIDPHYEYTKKELNVCYDYEDDEGEDRVDLVKEQYHCNREWGSDWEVCTYEH